MRGSTAFGYADFISFYSVFVCNLYQQPYLKAEKYYLTRMGSEFIIAAAKLGGPKDYAVGKIGDGGCQLAREILL